MMKFEDNIQIGDTLYCLDGSSVIIRDFNEDSLAVEYKGKSYSRPISALGKTLLLRPLLDSKTNAAESDDDTDDEGKLFVGRVLYNKQGKPCDVTEIDEENCIVTLVEPPIDGARTVRKHNYYQIGRDLFFNQRESNLHPIELRKLKKYQNYFLLWDNSDEKTRFSKEIVPIDDDYEKEHFAFVEEALLKEKEHVIEKYGDGLEAKAEYFGRRGENNYYADSKRIDDCILEPYFGRVDYQDENGCYIGKREIKGHVIEWTDERASLYYNYQLYVENRTYGLSLVRSYDISNGQYGGHSDLFYKELQSPLESDTTVIADPHLLKLLALNRSQKAIHDIIQSIQSNQYSIITHPFYNDILVEGCAGSGKTMIAYHRAKYMLRNDKSISPKDVFIISPTESLAHEGENLIGNLQLNGISRYSSDELYREIIAQYAKGKYITYVEDISEQKESIMVSAEAEKKLYSFSFLDDVADKVNAIMHKANNGEAFEIFLSQKGVALLKAIDEFCNIGVHDNAVEWLGDNESIRRTMALAESVSKMLASASIVSVENEIRRMESVLIEKRSELEKKRATIENDISLVKEKIQKEEETIKRIQDDAERLKKEHEEYQNSGRIGRLFRRINGVASGEEYDDLINGREKNLHVHTVELHNLENELEQTEIRPQILADEIEVLEDEFNSNKEMIESLSKKGVFLGEATTVSFDSLYRFFAEFDALVDDGKIKTALYATEDPINALNIGRKINNICNDISQYKVFAKICNQSYFNEVAKFILETEMGKLGFNAEGCRSCERFGLLYVYYSYFGALSEEKKWFFIDEFQDYSSSELTILRQVYPNASFNYFGDYAQCITPKGIHSKEDLAPQLKGINAYVINENYRNALEITSYVNEEFGTQMLPIGIHGKVFNVDSIDKHKETKDKNDRIAVIYKREEDLQSYGISSKDSQYYFWTEHKEMAPLGHISVLPINQVKGLEFERVFVIPTAMDEQEKYVAYTRALSELYILR